MKEQKLFKIEEPQVLFLTILTAAIQKPWHPQICKKCFQMLDTTFFRFCKQCFYCLSYYCKGITRRNKLSHFVISVVLLYPRQSYRYISSFRDLLLQWFKFSYIQCLLPEIHNVFLLLLNTCTCLLQSSSFGANLTLFKRQVTYNSLLT